MRLEEALKQIDDMNLRNVEINPSEMTLEEIARLRFTTLSEYEEKLVNEELIKRGVIDA